MNSENCFQIVPCAGRTVHAFQAELCNILNLSGYTYKTPADCVVSCHRNETCSRQKTYNKQESIYINPTDENQARGYFYLDNDSYKNNVMRFLKTTKNYYAMGQNISGDNLDILLSMLELFNYHEDLIRDKHIFWYGNIRMTFVIDKREPQFNFDEFIKNNHLPKYIRYEYDNLYKNLWWIKHNAYPSSIFNISGLTAINDPLFHKNQLMAILAGESIDPKYVYDSVKKTLTEMGINF